MAKFMVKSPLDIGDSGEWVTSGEWVYMSDIAQRVIRVPAGKVTDLASIPRLVRLFIPQNGRHRAAAIIHDYLYEQKGDVPGGKLSRKLCDQIFLEAMMVSRVSITKRHLMYRAVRLFGGAWWKFGVIK